MAKGLNAKEWFDIKLIDSYVNNRKFEALFEKASWGALTGTAIGIAGIAITGAAIVPALPIVGATIAACTIINGRRGYKEGKEKGREEGERAVIIFNKDYEHQSGDAFEINVNQLREFVKKRTSVIGCAAATATAAVAVAGLAVAGVAFTAPISLVVAGGAIMVGGVTKQVSKTYVGNGDSKDYIAAIPASGTSPRVPHVGRRGISSIAHRYRIDFKREIEFPKHEQEVAIDEYARLAEEVRRRQEPVRSRMETTKHAQQVLIARAEAERAQADAQKAQADAQKAQADAQKAQADARKAQEEIETVVEKNTIIKGARDELRSIYANSGTTNEEQVDKTKRIKYLSNLINGDNSKDIEIER